MVTSKKATINRKNTLDGDEYCFAYAITIALNHHRIRSHLEIVSNLEPYVNNYNWSKIEFPSYRKDWEIFEKNNTDIALNILMVPYVENDEDDEQIPIEPLYKSKFNNTRKNQVVLLMITDGEKWHYLALKSIQTNDDKMKPTKALSRLFKNITSKNTTNYDHCLNCLNSFRSENVLKNHEPICSNHEYCKINMPTTDDNILKYTNIKNQQKNQYTIYLDIECTLEKFNDNNMNCNTKKINKQIPNSYALLIVSEHKENQLYHYRGLNSVEHISNKLFEIGEEILNERKYPMKVLTREENESHKNTEVYYICKGTFNKSQNYRKVKDHCHYTGKYRGAAHSLCNLRYQEQRNIPIIIHNGSNYDFHLLIKDLAKKF